MIIPKARMPYWVATSCPCRSLRMSEELLSQERLIPCIGRTRRASALVLPFRLLLGILQCFRRSNCLSKHRWWQSNRLLHWRLSTPLPTCKVFPYLQPIIQPWDRTPATRCLRPARPCPQLHKAWCGPKRWRVSGATFPPAQRVCCHRHHHSHSYIYSRSRSRRWP